jgi:hypothetical protein
MNVKTTVKAGQWPVSSNHNEAVVRATGLKAQTSVKAGGDGTTLNHNEAPSPNSTWVAGSDDTRAGRALVVDSRVQVSRNIRREEPWDAGIPLLDLAALGVEQQ